MRYLTQIYNTAFPRQVWLRERASILRDTYTVMLLSVLVTAVMIESRTSYEISLQADLLHHYGCHNDKSYPEDGSRTKHRNIDFME